MSKTKTFIEFYILSLFITIYTFCMVFLPFVGMCFVLDREKLLLNYLFMCISIAFIPPLLEIRKY